jgi:hypothetical protein
VIVVFVLLLAILVAIIVVPVAIVTATRVAGRTFNGARTDRLLDPALDDRLARIEEAIDAMALQIESLNQQQRALLGAPTETTRAPLEEEPD